MIKTTHLHWLLDMIVEFPFPLHYFLPHVHSEHLNAIEIPEFQIDDYAKLIELALEEGHLELVHGKKILDLSEAKNAVNIHAHGQRSKSDGPFDLRMTPLGGEAWESMASPQWDRIFFYSSLVPDTKLRVSATLASRNLDAVMAYLGWFDRLDSVDVDWDTLKIETRSNYPITYWKRLDGVHEATLEGIYHLPERYAPTFASDWMLSLSKWRLRPWERTDWAKEADNLPLAQPQSRR